MTKHTTWKLIELNNKSRKGTYIYIRIGKNRGDYYKFKGTKGEIEATIKYQQDKTKKKKKGTRKQYTKAYAGKKLTKKEKKVKTQAQKYLRKIKQKGTLISHIKKGIGKATINNIARTTNTTKKRAKTKLLKNMILDKEILKLIILPENINKLKHRMEYKITYYDKNGTTLLKANKMNETLENIIAETEGPERLKSEIRKAYGKTAENLKQNGWKNITQENEGIINNSKLEIKFMKGK